jgi:hypothetical protein
VEAKGRLRIGLQISGQNQLEGEGLKPLLDIVVFVVDNLFQVL